MDGKEVKITKPIDAMQNGIAYLAEDRKRDGIIGDLSVRENIILALQVKKGFFKPISRSEAERFADEYIKLLDIKTASTNTPIKSLSGGNQQKVILGRWLLTHPKYLILDEPTRGIDVGAKFEIYKLINDLVESGRSVLMISSEMEELIGMSDRIIVLAEGQMTGELQKEEFDADKIMAYASSIVDQA
jgi:simple sugar transport system ATP-binding protein